MRRSALIVLLATFAVLAFASSGAASSVTKGSQKLTATLSPATPKVGQTLIATAKVTNTGSTSVPVTLNATLEGTSSAYGYGTAGGSLAPGESQTHTWKIKLTKADRGTWKLTVSATSRGTTTKTSASARVS